MVYQRIAIKEDDDGHIYIIPHHLDQHYNELLNKAIADDNFDDFNDEFEKYSIGGCLSAIPLYIRV